MTSLEDINSLEQTAAYLRITPNVLVNMARQGKIGSLKIGRTWTFPLIEIEAFVTAQTVRARSHTDPHGLTPRARQNLARRIQDVERNRPI